MRGNEIQWTTRIGMVLTWKTPTSSLSLAVFEIMCAIQGFICKLQINRDSTMKTIFWSVSWLQQSVKNDWYQRSVFIGLRITCKEMITVYYNNSAKFPYLWVWCIIIYHSYNGWREVWDCKPQKNRKKLLLNTYMEFLSPKKKFGKQIFLAQKIICRMNRFDWQFCPTVLKLP